MMIGRSVHEGDWSRGRVRATSDHGQHRLLTGVAVVALLCASANGAQAAWQHFTSKDGLGDDDVTEIFQQRSGVLWMASRSLPRPLSKLGVISRFDGLSWRTWNLDGFGPFDDPFGEMRFYEDKENTLWLVVGGVNAGFIGRFDNTGWHYRDVSAPISQIWTAIGFAEDSAKRLFVAFSAGLWEITSRDSIKVAPVELPSGLGLVSAIAGDSLGVWLAGYGSGSPLPPFYGAARLVSDTWERVTSENSGLPDDGVERMFRERDGALWFALRDSGLARYKGGSWTRYSERDGLSNLPIRSFAEDAEGGIWCSGGSAGYSRFDGRHWTSYGVGDGFPYYGGECLLGDDSGNLWIGLTGGGRPAGLMRFDRSLLRKVSVPGQSQQLWMEDSAGNLWLSGGGCLIRYVRSHWDCFDSPPDLMWALREARNGKLWAGTEGGPFSLADSTWTAPPDSVRSAMGSVRDIMEDPNGTIWFRTSVGKLWSFDRRGWQSHLLSSVPESSTISMLLADSKGRIWFG